jgi:hypothetical protein
VYVRFTSTTYPNARSAILLAVAVLAAAVWLVGCSSDQGNAPLLKVRNETGITIDLVLRSVADTGSPDGLLLMDVASGTTTSIPTASFPGPNCTSGGIVIARDKQGNEVGRLSGSVCPGQLWVVGPPGSSAEASG